MKIISLLISLFGIIKTKALECVSVVNQKCMPRPKILDVNEGIGEVRKNIFACLFSVHNTISLSRHEQVCLMRQAVIISNSLKDFTNNAFLISILL